MPGYDGGLPQKFVLEVYHGDIDYLASSQPLYNVSNPDEPAFALAGLEASVEAGVHVAVYAVNAKGRSQPVILSEVTYRDAEKRTGKYEITSSNVISSQTRPAMASNKIVESNVRSDCVLLPVTDTRRSISNCIPIGRIDGGIELTARTRCFVILSRLLLARGYC